MANEVLIKDIVDALQMQFEEILQFLDLDSGKVVAVTRDCLREAEEMEEDQEANSDEFDDEMQLAISIQSSDRFIGLPSKFDIHEWQIMEDFALSVSNRKICEELQDVIHGAGAFRKFKSVIRRRGIEKDWFAFRENALRQIAIDWCEEHGIVWK